LALIKGSKYRPPDGESPAEAERDREEFRKGSLIKSKAPAGAGVDVFWGSSAEQPFRKKGKLLKAATVPDDAAGLKTPDIRKLSDSAILKSSQVTYTPTDSMSEVVTVPSSDRSAEPEPEAATVEITGELQADDSEFRVESANPTQNIDVEALIAEAEAKGREKADKIIEHAQGEAKKLIDQAKIYSETAKREAHEEGFKQGKEDGYKAGLAEFSALMNEAKSLISQVIAERNRMLEEVEPELASLSISIAEKIIGMALKSSPDVVLSVVRQAMLKIKSRQQVTVRVHPDDVEHVKANKDLFIKLVEGIKELNVEPDNRVDRGGCLIETNLGNTDARIKTQLMAVELAFKNARTGNI